MEGSVEEIREVPVLIVGASIVGLTLTALLAHHGLEGCLTVEKHTSTAIHPRATLMMPRTMQAFKELGLYEIMQSESLKYYDEKTCIVVIESLAGKLLYYYLDDVNEGIEEVSATKRLFLTQQALEPLLRAKTKELGAEIQFSIEMIDFTQDANGVTALLRNIETGAHQKVRAKYMVGADGFRSTTRNKLGIPTRGPGLLSRALTIYFQIKDKEKLATLANAHYSGVIYVVNEFVRAFFRFDREKQESFLVINAAGAQGSEESRYPADTMSMDKAAEYLRAAIGADVDFEILRLTTWNAIADVPDRICQGRVLLAGDAAHRMPPSGGFGGNTGVQDAHNLAWKLAYVLQGKATDWLVQSTYEAERLPVARQTVNQALCHYVSRTEPSLKYLIAEHGISEVPDLDLELAYRYNSGALCAAEGQPGRITEDTKTAIASPGSVAHHVLVNTVDVATPFPIAHFLGRGFVLFVGAADTIWELAAKQANETVHNLPTIELQKLVFNADSSFARRYAVEPSGAVLVRPDGFVAWSVRTVLGDVEQAEGKLVEVMRRCTAGV
ncbi:FAD binding domain-containing protein [Xylariales sp. PMI_506]|nr:FAD binding domain-containing protein [Xylariales sp. PMI_506]